MEKNNFSLISFFLRLAISIPFLYAAIAAFLDPTSWIGFLPGWIGKIMPKEIALSMFSVFQIILSIWLLSGKWLRYSSVLASAILLSITVFNIGALDIVFRDVGLLLASISLTLLASGE